MGGITYSKKGAHIHKKRIFASFKTKISSPIGHLPATEVRRIVRQNPNLASDFIVIRAMVECTDFGLAVRSPPSLYCNYFTSSLLFCEKKYVVFTLFFLTSAQSLELIPQSWNTWINDAVKETPLGCFRGPSDVVR